MPIRKRVLLLVLSCSIISLILLGAIAAYNMMIIRENAVETGENIGREAASSSSEVLEQQSKAELEQIAIEKSNQIELSLSKIKNNVTILSDEMTEIVSNPQNYSARRIYEPRREDAGFITAQLMYSESVQNRASLQYEIGLTANIQDFLVKMNQASDIIASSYVASETGFIIQADKISDRKFHTGSNIPDFYEAFSRPWYQKASAEARLIFTDVVQDIHGGGLCIICAAPYYRRGNFAGVVGMGAYLREINQIVMNTRIGQTGFGFVINQDGHVLFSPRESGDLVADSKMLESQESTLVDAAKKMINGENGSMPVKFNGLDCFLAYAPMSETGWSFGTITQSSEISAPMINSRNAILNETANLTGQMDSQIWNMTLAMIFMVIILLTLVTIFGYKMSDHFVKPIHELSDGVREISSGNLDKKSISKLATKSSILLKVSMQ